MGIKKPYAVKAIIDTIPIIDEAVATSGSYEQFFEYRQKKYSHIINPKTGFPVSNNNLSVTVVAKNCTTADALATAFFVMGFEKISEFLSRVPSTLKIFLLMQSENGEQLYIF